MGFFGPKKADDRSATGATGQTPSPPGTSAASPGRVGIDHAIQLMRTLPTDKNVDLVVKVLRTTLESLNIHVSDIVADATKRQQEIEARVAQLTAEIAQLEQEIATRAEEIRRMEAAHAETTRVKEYLELDDVEVLPADEA